MEQAAPPEAQTNSGPPAARTTGEPWSNDAYTSPRRRQGTEQASSRQLQPRDALESLHAEIVQIEAFAHAAGQAITQYPFPSEPTQRRAFARIYTLVTRVANDTDAAVAHGQALVAALSDHLQRRHTED
jgi:hypothetical protein